MSGRLTSEPVFPPIQAGGGCPMPEFCDAAELIHPRWRGLLALGPLSQLSQTWLGRAGLAHPHPGTASGQGVAQA